MSRKNQLLTAIINFLQYSLSNNDNMAQTGK